MKEKTKETTAYNGFEQGPIRPPSEATSFLLRVTRNCPWNRCTFCPVYKDAAFSLRPLEHIIKDIDSVYHCICMLRGIKSNSPEVTSAGIAAAAENITEEDWPAFQAAVHWMLGGMSSIFIQDANSLVIKPGTMAEILLHLRKRFPEVKRITSYARSDTMARVDVAALKEIADAGLNRIHIGMESGSDKVLERVKKGATKVIHIKAGLRVKEAGIELSEYVMPGLGGNELSEIHARETADALNHINPDFIRLRTLSIPNNAELYQDYSKGRFDKCTESMVVKEILLLLENLGGIDSMIKSDHILNLLQEVEGRWPRDRERMIGIIKSYLAMSPMRKCVFQVGRRMGIFSELSDMKIQNKASHVEQICRQLRIRPDNVDAAMEQLMKTFV